ncbi:hypothetical protein LGV61_07735 [Desulfurispirillum indicum]|uniref:hypothetical protein n=1 Tax=Desulfurispirillum indicum TaxID=936456 RepID=UPI001CFA27B8|nr:hypothetical protein [Desulfurispirillum indicum]UCZ55621.1 hypothetical protein LGV61_07735 [Desulfurispirillum indicum]
MLGDKERSQVDMYDVFGYLVPGMILLLAVALVFQIIHDVKFISVFIFIKDLSLGLYVTLTVFFLLLSYIIGHIIATLSEFIFDRIFVEKILGYPYKNILFGRKDYSIYSEWRSNKKLVVTGSFYRILVMAIFLIGISLVYSESSSTVPQFTVIGLVIVVMIIVRWIENISLDKWAKYRNLIEDRLTMIKFDMLKKFLSKLHDYYVTRV